MGAVLLDTTVLIDVLRGMPAAQRLRTLHRSGDLLFTCPINVEELVRGLRPGEEGAIDRLLGGLRLFPLGRQEAERAGRWRRSFAEEGRTLSQADCLVAAAAVSVGARLATGNLRDFPMPELIMEEWPVGG
jgi:predicted nucleic acid-binding protein